ncbi:MAG: iron-containing alcohol dehydrogenase [Acidimicrobiia bacterium]|nr:iron-containing alcohol dehydrogenase [Acidimicrobiia bacterium]
MNSAAGGTLAGRLVHPAGEGIVWGPGTVARDLPGLLERTGIRRPFLVTTASVERSGLADRVAAVVGDSLTGTFAGSREHTPEPAVLAGAAAARAAGADGLIALGGSSVVDLTKGIAMVLAEGGDFARLRGHRPGDGGTEGGRRRPRLNEPKLPQISLPTTLSGAEFTGAAGITDPATGAKEIYADAKLAPRWVILDPEITVDTPSSLWAATGMKALADTIETQCSRRATPLSDAVTRAAMTMLLADLGPSLAGPPPIDESQLAARGRCQYAVGMALPQLAMVGVGLVAGLRHQLGGALGVGHGVASTIVLPHVLRWNAPACPDQLAAAARAAGRASADELIAAVEGLTMQLGLPTRLRDVGVTAVDFPAVADHVLGDPAISTNPRPVTGADDVIEVLRAAL